METFSPKVSFYLEHRKQIDEWAELENQARTELHGWLSSWAEPLREFVDTEMQDEDVEVFQFLDGTEPHKLFLHRRSWKRPGAKESRHPEVGIGLEWTTDTAHRSKGWTQGVWVNRKGGRGEALHSALVEVLSNVNEFPKTKRHWPVRISPARIEDVVIRSDADPGSQQCTVTAMEGHRLAVFHKIRWLWIKCAGNIDEAIKARRMDGS